MARITRTRFICFKARGMSIRSIQYTTSIKSYPRVRVKSFCAPCQPSMHTSFHAFTSLQNRSYSLWSLRTRSPYLRTNRIIYMYSVARRKEEGNGWKTFYWQKWVFDCCVSSFGEHLGLMPSLSSRIFYIRRDTYYSPGRNLRVHFHLRLCLDQGLASGQRAWLSRSSHLHHHSSLPHPLRSIHSNLVPF